MPRSPLVAGLISLGWLIAGCCSRGRYPSDIKAGSHVRRDEFVDSWRVNGEKVCAQEILAASNCYVLEVQYRASFVKEHDSGFRPLRIVSPMASAIEEGEQATRADYHSSLIPFALRVKAGASYYVTANFTGDEFLPRIVELDVAGHKMGQIDPASTTAQLRDCRAGKPLSPPPIKPATSDVALRIGWSRVDALASRSCD